MFKNLRVKKSPVQFETRPGSLTSEWLLEDSDSPIILEQINNLPNNIKLRVYRNLLPPGLMIRFNIDPITWKGPDGQLHVGLKADEQTGFVHLWAHKNGSQQDEFFRLEISDNPQRGIDINLIHLNDPEGQRYSTDFDQDGEPTLFGTTRRNLEEERRAMDGGLAPGQIRKNLGASALAFQQIEAFLATLGHRAYFLDPLTYSSALVFEKRGFAYVRGHKLMDDIQHEFQPGGKLHEALDGSTPFRKSDQWRTVRGRAWAIHDGILENIGEQWDGLRMIKQVGRHAGVDTFPDAEF